MDLEEQYDKIYRYCYFKVHHREIAEDITQEAFLRCLAHSAAASTDLSLPYLYTIAKNLCIDEIRRRKPEVLDDNSADLSAEDNMLTQLSVRIALSKLKEADSELLMLRYGNDTPVSVICKLYGISRFAVYRRLSQAEKNLKAKLGKEDLP